MVIAALLPATAAAQGDTIDAVIRGTSAQLGQEVNIKIVVDHFSTLQDKQALVNAFAQGQQNALVNALQKMKPAGQLQPQKCRLRSCLHRQSSDCERIQDPFHHQPLGEVLRTIF